MEMMTMMKMVMMMMIVLKLEGYCAGQMDLLLSSPHLYANEQSFLPLIVIIVNMISAAAAASTSKQPKIPSLTKFLFQNFAKTSSKVQQSQDLSALAKETATKKLQQAIFQGITKQFDQTVKKNVVRPLPSR